MVLSGFCFFKNKGEGGGHPGIYKIKKLVLGVASASVFVATVLL